MNVNIRITKDTAGPAVRRIIGALTGAGRRELNGAMGAEGQHLTTEHLRALAASRHGTANRLGATPTNHLAQAAEKVAQPQSLSSDDDGATLTINNPGIGRAFHDVKITPKNASALTLPISALAYGRRAGEFQGLFRIKGKNILAIMTPGGIVPLFALVRSVTQKQDRSLLPSDEEFEKSAALGAKRYIKMHSSN